MPDGRTIEVRGIQLGDFAIVTWRVTLAGKLGEILRIEVEREITRPVEMMTDVPFGLHLVRLFALWSRPDLRINHDPDGAFRDTYAPYEDRSKRRVIGYHRADELPRFVVHSSPMYPDLSVRISSGFYHVEQHYTRHVLLGVSSRNFASGPQVLQPATEQYTIEFELVPQGTLAPVRFQSANPPWLPSTAARRNRARLSSVACITCSNRQLRVCRRDRR
jgi:hypothetical protein